MMDADAVRLLLRVECSRAGGIAQFARVAGVSRQGVFAVLNANRPPRGKILDALDLEMVEMYRLKSPRIAR
ncbi:MAG: hypothetical protein M3Y22_01505 [Pseudomonadota bacterium]|nr:hypothetical protein [Pseudomonadota bacterium]